MSNLYFQIKLKNIKYYMSCYWNIFINIKHTNIVYYIINKRLFSYYEGETVKFLHNFGIILKITIIVY